LSDLYAFNNTVPANGTIKLSNLRSQVADPVYASTVRGLFTVSVQGTANQIVSGDNKQYTNPQLAKSVHVLPDANLVYTAVAYSTGSTTLNDWSIYDPYYSNVSVTGGFIQSQSYHYTIVGSYTRYGQHRWFVQLQQTSSGNYHVPADIDACGSASNPTTVVAIGTDNAVQALPNLVYVRNTDAATTPFILRQPSGSSTYNTLVAGIASDASLSFGIRLMSDRIRVAANTGTAGDFFMAFSRNTLANTQYVYGNSTDTSATVQIANLPNGRVILAKMYANGLPTGVCANIGSLTTTAFVNCLRVAPDGNVFVTVNTSNNLQVYSSAGTLADTVQIGANAAIVLLKFQSSLLYSWSKVFYARNTAGANVACKYGTFDITPSGNVVMAISTGATILFNPGTTTLAQVGDSSNIITYSSSNASIFTLRLNGADGSIVHGGVLGGETTQPANTIASCVSVAAGADEGFAMSWINFVPVVTAVTPNPPYVTFRYRHNTTGTTTSLPLYNWSTLKRLCGNLGQTTASTVLPVCGVPCVTGFDATTTPTWASALVRYQGIMQNANQNRPYITMDYSRVDNTFVAGGPIWGPTGNPVFFVNPEAYGSRQLLHRGTVTNCIALCKFSAVSGGTRHKVYNTLLAATYDISLSDVSPRQIVPTVFTSGSAAELAIIGNKMLSPYNSAFLNFPATYTTSVKQWLEYTPTGMNDHVMPATFTIEAWVQLPSAATASNDMNANLAIIGTFGGTDTWYLGRNKFVYSGNASINFTSIPFDQWVHVAVTRDEINSIRVFQNGTVMATQTVSAVLGGDAAFLVGNNNADSGFMSGYIDTVRVIKDDALYTANFTPPALPSLVGSLQATQGSAT